MSTPDDKSAIDSESEKLNKELIANMGQYHVDDGKVAVLLENGADPFYLGLNERSAYMLAARAGHLQWVRLFLQQGADVNQLVPHEMRSVFLNCLQKCDLEFLKEMAGMGADLHARDSNNENAIFFASCGYEDKMKKIKWLEEQGVDLDVANDSGHTPLYKACDNRDLELVAYLLSKGCGPAPVDLRNKSTPLVKAVEAGATAIVAALLKAGADSGVKNWRSKTCYQVALDKGLLEIAKLINATDAEADFAETGIEEKVAKLKKDIITKLKNGGCWYYSDREVSSSLWYEGGKFHHYCRDHSTDVYIDKGSLADDEAALSWLYHGSNGTDGLDTAVAVHEKILRSIR